MADFPKYFTTLFLLFYILSCSSDNGVVIEHKPVEEFIGEKKEMVTEKYENTKLIKDEYHEEEDLYFKEWSYTPRSKKLELNTENIPDVKFWIRQKRGYITGASRSFVIENKENAKDIYISKTATYTQKFGTPDCVAGGAAKFFSGGEIEKMDLNKIGDPIYLINCGPNWNVEMDSGVILDIGISTKKPIYTMDTAEEIEEVEVGVAVMEESKYLDIKNR